MVPTQAYTTPMPVSAVVAALHSEQLTNGSRRD